MLKCWFPSRHSQISVKLTISLLVVVFYITILYRESLNAIDQNRVRLRKRKINNFSALGNALISAQQYRDTITNVSNYSNQSYTRFIILPVRQTPWGSSKFNITVTTLNPVYEYSEEIHQATEHNLQQRYSHLQGTCKRYALQAIYPPRSQEFFISTGHNLLWCNVFKAASSSWMYYFNILGGYNPQYLQSTKKQPLQLARKIFPRPQLSELYENLPNSLSFLFVRDPFERILSAYRDKLEGGRNHFYRRLGQRIAYRFRRTPIHGSGPTFKEFLNYLIYQHERNMQPLDEHWAPIYKFCTPCSIPFKIIGKVETFNRDSEFIIRQAGLESLLLGKLPTSILKKVGNLAKGTKTDRLLAKYFKDIDHILLKQLLNIYRLDFELFDYNYTKYFEYNKNTPTTILPSTLTKLNIRLESSQLTKI